MSLFVVVVVVHGLVAVVVVAVSVVASNMDLHGSKGTGETYW